MPPLGPRGAVRPSGADAHGGAPEDAHRGTDGLGKASDPPARAPARRRLAPEVGPARRRLHRAALDAVASAIGSPAPAPVTRGPGRPPTAAASAAPAPRKGKQAKRTPEDVAKMGEAVVTYVAMSHGQSVEQIGKALGVKTKDLALPIIRMVAAKKLRTTGERRGTRYFVK